MNAIDFSTICRACLSQSEATASIFAAEGVMDQQINVCDMFSRCTSLVVSKEDGLPDHICSSCMEEIHRAFAFKSMCEKSDATLRSYLNAIVPMMETNNTSEVNYIKFDDETNDTTEKCDLTKCEDDVNLGESCDNWDSSESNADSAESSNMEESNHDSDVQDRIKSKSYSCEECNEECLGLASYWKHMANLHGKVFKCDICETEFKSQSLLSQHKAEHEILPKSPKGKSGIVKKRNLPRTCDICNKTFRFHSNLERHRLIHTGEKPFLCNVCGKGFGQMSYLKIHSFIHTGEKPYKCQTCGKSFAAPGTLMTHVRIHTGERPHVCKICGKDFPQSGYLSAHIRTHTGEKPVECKVCHRRFNQSGRLVIHMRIHSGEKPYVCKECGRSFAVKGTLKKHIRTHTGERPYICSVCGQAFAQSGTLATHMKIHRHKE